MGISVAAVVQHLAILEEGGRSGRRKAGRIRRCRMEPGAAFGGSGFGWHHRQLSHQRRERFDLGQVILVLRDARRGLPSDVGRVESLTGVAELQASRASCGRSSLRCPELPTAPCRKCP